MQTIDIEWRHLDVGGETCERCGDTGSMLRELVGAMNRECMPKGTSINLRETRLGPERIAESNIVLIDGQPLEAVQPAISVGVSSCGSCGDLTGRDEVCRTIEVDGKVHEVPPPYLIRNHICRIADCC